MSSPKTSTSISSRCGIARRRRRSPTTRCAMRIEARGGDDLRTVAVTSPAAGDGKTTTAINLAGALAHRREGRVLLVDVDLRRPSVCPLLGLADGVDARRPRRCHPGSGSDARRRGHAAAGVQPLAPARGQVLGRAVRAAADATDEGSDPAGAPAVRLRRARHVAAPALSGRAHSRALGRRVSCWSSRLTEPRASSSRKRSICSAPRS